MNTIRENFILTCNTVLYSDDATDIRAAYERLLCDYKNILGTGSQQLGSNASCILDVLCTMFIEDNKNKQMTYTQDAYTYLQRFVSIVSALEKTVLQEAAQYGYKYMSEQARYHRKKLEALQGYLLYCLTINDCDVKNKNIVDVAKLALCKY